MNGRGSSDQLLHLSADMPRLVVTDEDKILKCDRGNFIASECVTVSEYKIETDTRPVSR